MAADIRASGEALERAHVALRDASAAIDQILRDLDDRVRALRAAWSGEASDAYDAAHSAWTDQLAAMQHAVGEYGARVHRVDERYRDAASTIGNKIWR